MERGPAPTKASLKMTPLPREVPKNRSLGARVGVGCRFVTVPEGHHLFRNGLRVATNPEATIFSKLASKKH